MVYNFKHLLATTNGGQTRAKGSDMWNIRTLQRKLGGETTDTSSLPATKLGTIVSYLAGTKVLLVWLWYNLVGVLYNLLDFHIMLSRVIHEDSRLSLSTHHHRILLWINTAHM